MKLKIAKKKHQELSYDHSERDNARKMAEKAEQYLHKLEESDKYRKMSHGAYDIFQSIPTAKGEYSRQNHAKSLRKNHSKKKK